MKIDKDIKYFIIIITTIILIMYNIFIQKSGFFIISLSEILEVLVIGVFFYVLNKKDSNLNARKKILVEILNEIKELTEKESLYKVKNQSDLSDLFIDSKKLVNLIKYIEKHMIDIVDRDDIDYIYGEYEMYEDAVGLYIDKIKKFEEKEKEYKLYLSHISNRITEIKIKIYN